MSLTDHQIIELAKQYGYGNYDFYEHGPVFITNHSLECTISKTISAAGRKLIDLARAAYEANAREQDESQLIRN